MLGEERTGTAGTRRPTTSLVTRTTTPRPGTAWHNKARNPSLKDCSVFLTQNLSIDRCPSAVSSSSSLMEFCRICHCEAEDDNALISPCRCSGSLQYVHQSCLQLWLKSKDRKHCELCKFNFNMATKTKPFKEWEKLSMTQTERRKIVCSVTFHVIAITCVVWSLYVLIDRVVEEAQSGVIEWPFWTKLIVIAIGLIGGIVFMYVQCKMYYQYIARWRAYNKVIIIRNALPADLEAAASGKSQNKQSVNSCGSFSSNRHPSVTSNPSDGLQLTVPSERMVPVEDRGDVPALAYPA